MLLDNGAHNGRRILPAHLVTAMMTDHLSAEQRRGADFFLADGEGSGYGGSMGADGTYGWSGGAGTTARVDPRHGLVPVLLTQVALEGAQGSKLITAFDNLIAAEHG